MDVGARRIGLAVSDLLGITAQGIETLQRKNKRTDFEYLAKVIADYTVTEIVVGYPLRMSGVASAQTAMSKHSLRTWRRSSGCPCIAGMSA